MGRDLGTFHLRVELDDGVGWIEEWKTGIQYCGGSESFHPLNAGRFRPAWNSEEEIFDTMKYVLTEGDASCDCNKSLRLRYAGQVGPPEALECGDTLVLKRLTVIRPDGTEKILLEKE